MNPQMNYTPQQVMGHDSYSVPCRVGNWAEDEYLGALVAERIFAEKALRQGGIDAQGISDGFDPGRIVGAAPAQANAAQLVARDVH